MASKNPDFKVLDCTIRDGGYLNNWDFDKKFVKEVYRQLSRTGVDYVEIGLRNRQKKSTGLWYSTPEELVHELFDGVKGTRIVLLVDEVNADLSLIPERSKSLVSLYRVACHKDRIFQGLELAEKIKAKGYEVSLQLMGIMGYSQQDIQSLIKPLASSSIDYLYFADSYGSVFPNDVKNFITWLKPTEKKLGFHPHNNLQLAFANTLQAIEEGIDIIDGTIYGMGRGPGNLPLEVFLMYLEKSLHYHKFNSMPVLDLIDRYFIHLNNDLRWGYNLPYMLSGLTGVHPNYAKYLVDRKEFKVDDMLKVLEVIQKLNIIGYDQKVIDNVLATGYFQGADVERKPSDDKKDVKKLLEQHSVTYKDKHKDKDFLIIANGPSLLEHKEEVASFIDQNNPVTLGANFLGDLFVPDYHAFSNKKRFISYIAQVKDQSKLLLSTSFDEELIKDYTDKSYERIVHLDREADFFNIQDDVITSNCRNIATLLIGVAIVMGAKRIFIAGLDGYNFEDINAKTSHFYEESEEADDYKLLLEKHKRNEQFLDSINEYLTSHQKDGLTIITPTSYKHFYNSVQNWS